MSLSNWLGRCFPNKKSNPNGNDKKNQNNARSSTNINSKREHIWGLADEPPLKVSSSSLSSTLNQSEPLQKDRNSDAINSSNNGERQLIGHRCNDDTYQRLSGSFYQSIISEEGYEPRDSLSEANITIGSNGQNDNYYSREYKSNECTEKSFCSIGSHRASVSSPIQSELGERAYSFCSANDETSTQQLDDSHAADNGMTATDIRNCSAHSFRSQLAANNARLYRLSNTDFTTSIKNISKIPNELNTSSSSCAFKSSNSQPFHFPSFSRSDVHSALAGIQKPDQCNIHSLTKNGLENCEKKSSEKSDADNGFIGSCQHQKEAKTLVDAGTDPHLYLETTSVTCQTDFEPYYSPPLSTTSATVDNNENKSRNARKQESPLQTNANSADKKSISKPIKPSVSSLHRSIVEKEIKAGRKRKSSAEAPAQPRRSSRNKNKNKKH